MSIVSSWGRLTKNKYLTVSHSFLTESENSISTMSNFIPHGNGRSYGDVALNSTGAVLKCTNLDRLIEFDLASGILTCEAGLLLGQIQSFAVPLGWILPVTPGTQFVTVAGAIANDIHGKNHHQYGTFGNHVKSITLIRTTGEVFECSPNNHVDWFKATIGGLGLTGLILKASIQLKRVSGPWLDTQTLPYHNLRDFLELSGQSERDWEYTVSWIDAGSRDGRGLFMRANHVDCDMPSPKEKSKRHVFCEPPFSIINGLTLKAFNAGYFYLNKKDISIKKQHYKPFFYPLDNILEWNKIYGSKGFYQYQSVVPFDVAKDATDEMMKIIKKSGEGSFLSVLKTFGQKPSLGLLSFVQPGVTLAMDFPNKGAASEKLFASLDAVVMEAGGRLYLAKDARMPRELFEFGYPKFSKFLKYRDPGISSDMSKRLMGY